MAKTKRFVVNLYPAHKSASGLIGYSFLVGAGNTAKQPKHQFTAAGADAAVAEAERFATEYGEACKASVRCLDRPNPPGFDAKTRNLYYNMDKAPVT